MNLKKQIIVGSLLLAQVATSEASPLTLRYCESLRDALICDARCTDSGFVEYRVSIDLNYVIEKHTITGMGTTKIKNLGNCAVWDRRNWDCTENDDAPYQYKMRNGHLTQRLLRQSNDKTFCAK